MTTTYTAPPKNRVGPAATGVSAAVALACAALIVPREGEVRHTYADLNGKLTYCYGSTAGAVAGRTYTHQQCLDALQHDAEGHAAEITRCLPASLPVETRAAFISAGYNMGAPTFCRSSMSRKALRGDLPGACNALGAYVWTNGKDCRIAANRCSGIVKRRDAEIELCRKGLK